MQVSAILPTTFMLSHARTCNANYQTQLITAIRTIWLLQIGRIGSYPRLTNEQDRLIIYNNK